MTSVEEQLTEFYAPHTPIPPTVFVRGIDGVLGYNSLCFYSERDQDQILLRFQLLRYGITSYFLRVRYPTLLTHVFPEELMRIFKCETSPVIRGGAVRTLNKSLQVGKSRNGTLVKPSCPVSLKSDDQDQILRARDKRNYIISEMVRRDINAPVPRYFIFPQCMKQ